MRYTNVELEAITRPTIEGIATAEEFVAYVARVSNPSNQMNSETAPKLLKYLIKNKHWSPFEMVHLVMKIETTRDISRQILRHRSFSFQEFSGRYASMNNTGYVVREPRLQDTKNRQSSLECDDPSLAVNWDDAQRAVLDLAKNTYEWALAQGIAKEQARAVLPEGLVLTRLYMAGSLRSWIHYCALRGEEGTQKEHRLIAKMAENVLKKEFPSISELLHEV